MQYIYAAIAICIAVIGGITDIRYGRVKNKHLIYALACLVCTFVIDCLIHKSISIDILSVALNMVLSIAVTVLLYIKDIWAPGDGKLFLLISLTYPRLLSPCLAGNIFPALDIVIYSFAIGYVALLVSALARRDDTNSKDISVTTLKNLSWTRIVNVIANIGLVSIIDTGLQYLSPEFLESNRSLCTLSMIAVVYLANKKIPIVRQVVGFIGLCAFISITYMNGIWSSMIMTIVQSTIISVFVEILNERIDKNSYRTITGAEIKPGMILSHASIWDLQNCIDPALPHSTTETRRSRLTVTQADAVKLWCKNAKRNVTIVEMLPFAPCIAIATIIHLIRFIAIYR